MHYEILCPAKINLFLHILGKQADGYHQLESLVTFANIGDKLRFTANEDDLHLTISGEYAKALGSLDDNLIIKATQAFEQHFNVKINGKFKLVKNLPVASGIGGGSSNAAGAIRLLLQHYKFKTDASFNDMLLTLGADVPVCFKAQTCIMAGIGEQLEPWDNLPQLHAVLANPNLSVSTKEIFLSLNLNKGTTDYNFLNIPQPKLNNLKNYIHFLATQRNDMQKTAAKICPKITEVLQSLNTTSGALLSQMSGSGATCFALFTSKKEAELAAKNLNKKHPTWWIKPCQLG